MYQMQPFDLTIYDLITALGLGKIQVNILHDCYATPFPDQSLTPAEKDIVYASYFPLGQRLHTVS